MFTVSRSIHAWSMKKDYNDRDEVQHTCGVLMLNDDTILLLSLDVPASSNVYCNGEYLLGKVSL